MAEEPKENEQPEVPETTEPAPSKEASSIWETLEPLVTEIGKWAWVIGIINGLIYILVAVYWIALFGPVLVYIPSTLFEVIWNILGAVIAIFFSLVIVRPRFSNKCKNQDWDYLLNDVLMLGNIRFPWMFIWAIILSIFGYGWGGAAVLFCAFVLVFMGPKPYQWTE
ncbi:MAG: conserved membrane protein of unknown function [Promethearchaeota archaeon]|nr:MAG: conserved membrane protein of unknown function [Candidatus Lokiarchaeota archaeon]